MTALLLVSACGGGGGGRAESADSVAPAAIDSGGAPACPDGELEQSDGSCLPEACGTGPWGTVEEADAWVDAAAAEGGDGGRDAPFASVQAAADAIGGGRVAVADGTYVENLYFEAAHDGLELLGRCAERVTIDGSGGVGLPALWFDGDRGDTMAASGLTLSGGAGTLAVTWGELRAEDVAVRDSEAFGVYVAGRSAALVLERVTVEGTTTDVDGDWGAALWAESGAAVTASSVRVSGAALLGFVAVDAEVSLSGCTVADTPAALVVSGDDGVLTFGAGSVTGASLRGAEATNGAALSVDGSTFADGAGVGVHLADDGTTATLDDVVVDGVAVNEEGFGVGVWVDDGATATVTGCSIQGAAEEGLRMQSDAIATLHDSSIIATGGHGAWVHGSTLQWEGGGSRRPAGRAWPASRARCSR